MSKARAIVDQLLVESREVAWVIEAGTADSAQALYVGGKLIISDPNGSYFDLLKALGITPREVYIANGFYDRHNEWPDKLSALKNEFRSDPFAKE